MPKICYVTKTFSSGTREVLDLANDIIAEYAAQDFDLTLRQLYYQLVARDFIPNSQNDYKRLGRIISDARRAGMVDWDAITDRTRNLQSTSHWTSPAEILLSAEQSYRIDKWAGQSYRPECWVEKEALAGVVERACVPLDVNYFSCRGYSSDSEMWRAAQRYRRYAAAGQRMFILHLGDHDPSGIDMTRDIRDRLDLFKADPIVVRIALNMEQIEYYAPPPNPAKDTDSRWKDYVAEFGVTDSWELDALEPQVIVRLITEEIEQLLDVDLWEAKVAEEEAGKSALRAMRESYSG